MDQPPDETWKPEPLTNPPTSNPVTGSTEPATVVHVENADPLAPSNAPARANQQIIQPTAITPRVLNEVISFTPTTYTTAIITNSTSSTLLTTVTSNIGFIVFAIPLLSLYIGISDPANIATDGSNQWPTASAGGGNMPVYINPGDWGHSSPTNTNQAATMTVRNNVGSDQTVLFAIQWKLITQPSQAGQSGTLS